MEKANIQAAEEMEEMDWEVSELQQSANRVQH